MYTKVTIPLDGSALAEKALPTAVKLANSLGSQLLLLRATEVPVILTDTPEHELEYIHHAESYLEGVQKVITDPATPLHISPDKIQTLVGYGEKVREIAELAPFEKSDLIVMTTHGRTGISKMLLGSVAEKVLKKSSIPVLMIRPDHVESTKPLSETMAEPTSFDDHTNKVVITLDGTPESEAIIEPATEMVKNLGLIIHLLHVTQPIIPAEASGTWHGYDIEKETEHRREEASQYLEKIQAKIAAKGLNVVATVRTGDPHDEIVNYAQEIEASLLAMATHARGAIGHIIMGSIADEVVRKSHLPVLLVHTASKKHGKVESN